jgi:integrase
LDWRVVSRRYFRPIAREIGLVDIRPYDIRHTCATLLLADRVPVKVVSELLGHASATMTLDVYSHVIPSMQEKAAESIAKLLPEAEAI